jgi:ankyrin repeat protein
LAPTSALWQASCDGDWATVKILLANGDVDVEQVEGGGLTPIHVAAAGGFDDISELLIDHGADVFNKGLCGMTTLHWCAGSGSADGRSRGWTMEFLLQHVDGGRKLDINARNSEDQTPLHRAVLFGTIDSVEKLLNAGADPSLVDFSGKTAMHYAAAYAKSGKVSLLLGFMTSKALHMQDLRGDTPLHCAAGRGGHGGYKQNVFTERKLRIDIVELFIKFGLDVNVKNHDGNSAEQLAVQRRRLNLADLLKVADPHPFDAQGSADCCRLL